MTDVSTPHQSSPASSAALDLSTANPAGASGAGAFKDALEERLPSMLARTSADQPADAGLRARARLIEAARVVAQPGFPLRHQAARMALATAAGAYDWFFREAHWQLLGSAVPGATLVWALPSGRLAIDICSCDPLAAAGGPLMRSRAAQVWEWADASDADVALVRLLPLTAPATALGMLISSSRLPLAEASALAAAQGAPAGAAARSLVAS